MTTSMNSQNFTGIQGSIFAFRFSPIQSIFSIAGIPSLYDRLEEKNVPIIFSIFISNCILFYSHKPPCMETEIISCFNIFFTYNLYNIYIWSSYLVQYTIFKFQYWKENVYILLIFVWIGSLKYPISKSNY